MGHFGNISPEEKARLERFRQDKLWKEWISTLHPGTKKSYESGLFNLLGKLQLTPKRLLEMAEQAPKDLSKRVKIIFAKLNHSYSYSARNIMLASLKNFLALNEIQLPLIGFKLKVEKVVKPLFTWEDAERVISKANIECQPVYRFLLWSALDIERFIQLNQDKVRLADIKEQLKDKTRDWIRIDVPKGRKSSPPYYVLVPPDIARLLPVLDQQGKPIVSKNIIHYQWVNALKRAGFKFEHFGPHNLRSAWMGEATQRKLEPIVREHQLGHVVDGKNYQRMQQDEKWVIEQFRIAWKTQPLVTHDEINGLKETTRGLLADKIFDLEQEIAGDTDIAESLGYGVTYGQEGQRTATKEEVSKKQEQLAKLKSQLLALS